MVKEIAAATGRRKTAVARVRLTSGDGKCVINDVDSVKYIPSEALRNYMLQPLVITNMKGKLDLGVSVKGGGVSGQAGAVRHALSRALILSDVSLRDALKKAGCLTRDARMKERKKPGQPGARKRFQFSKR
ncbi:MAG: 30S ribosomal protein S9 [Lentisphaerae bacterium]|nr:30S ribosomal protein S9 [Lentisphaerota bacterium]